MNKYRLKEETDYHEANIGDTVILNEDTRIIHEGERCTIIGIEVYGDNDLDIEYNLKNKDDITYWINPEETNITLFRHIKMDK